MPITQHITTLAPWVTTPRYNHTRVTPHWFLARSLPTSDRAQALQLWSVASKRQAGYVTTSEYIVDVHSTSVTVFAILLLLSLAHGRALGHWCRFPHLSQRHHRLINVVPRPLLRDGLETFFCGHFQLWEVTPWTCLFLLHCRAVIPFSTLVASLVMVLSCAAVGVFG